VFLAASKGTATGGSVTVETGAAAPAGRSGDLNIKTSDSTTSGSVLVSTGDGANAGGIAIQGGTSSEHAGSTVSINAGSGVIAGGDVQVTAGRSAMSGGDVTITPGSGSMGSGKIVLQSVGGEDAVSVSEQSVSLQTQGKISLIAPTAGGSITFGIGLSTPLQVSTVAGKAAIIANAPIMASSVLYPADSSIATDVKQVDVDYILQKFKSVKMRKYRYTDEWRKSRGDTTGDEVRGIIAQELLEIFPEHVTVIPSYVFGDKEVADFHQVDKTGLLMDLIAAFQSQSRRFSVSSNTVTNWSKSLGKERWKG
jgi:hypothetical protein